MVFHDYIFDGTQKNHLNFVVEWNIYSDFHIIQKKFFDFVADVFIPTPENLLVNIRESKNLVEELLHQLPKIHTLDVVGEVDTYSALGAALEVAKKLMVRNYLLHKNCCKENCSVDSFSFSVNLFMPTYSAYMWHKS